VRHKTQISIVEMARISLERSNKVFATLADWNAVLKDTKPAQQQQNICIRHMPVTY